GELHAHQLALLDADAMLAGQAAAELDAELEDFGAAQLGTLEFDLVVGVVEYQGMQIAVAGMEDIDDAEAMAAADLGDFGQRLWELGERDHPIHPVVILDLADRPEGRFPPLPDRRALVGALAGAHPAWAIALRNLGDGIEQAVDFVVGAFD